jgi:hypothetical protein
MARPASHRRIACALALACALAPAAASGASVVYTDASNVWTAAPDGSVKRQVTTNGTTTVPWVAASQADTGRILAFLRAGNSSSMTYMNPDGSTITSGITPVESCDLGIIGPRSSRMTADGSLALFDYGCQRGVAYNFRTDPFTVVSSTARVSSVGSVLLDGWNGSFVPGTAGQGQASDRVLVSSLLGSGIFEYTMSAPPTNQLVLQPAAGGQLWSVDVSRDGTRLVGDVTSAAGTEELFVYGLAVPRSPGAGFTSGCRLVTGPNPSQPNWSPDGAMVAWSDEQGAKVAAVTSIAGSVQSPPPCGMGPTTVISSTGRQPVFSNAPAPAPLAAPAPAPAPDAGSANGSGGGAAASRVSIAAPRAMSRSAIRKRGIAVSTRCPAACSVRGTMVAGRKVIARGSVRLRRAGRATVRLRARVPARVKVVTVTLTRAGRTGSRAVRVTG